MTALSIKQGKKYDDPKSVAEIPKFVKLHNLNLDEIEKEVKDYKCFNEFFARKLKVGARPADSPDDPSIAVCHADSRMMLFPDVTEATK